MKQINSFLVKLTLLLLGIFICQNSYAIDYPEIVYPEENEYVSVTLSDGTKAVLTSHWVQNTDYLDYKNYPFFAVSGDYLFIYDKPNNKILKFDRLKGTHIEDLTINWGDFNEHEIGYMGTDDAQNIFISNGYENTVDIITLPKSNLNISIIDLNGNVTKQLKSDVLTIMSNDLDKKIAYVKYDFVNIKGDITKDNNFLVSLPVLIKKNGGSYYLPRLTFFQKTENNTLIDIINSNVVQYSNDNNDNSGQLNSVYYSFSPMLWTPGKSIDSYDVNNGEYFTGVETLSYTKIQSVNIESRHTKFYNTSSLNLEGITLTGASCFKYGDKNMIIYPYKNSEGNKMYVKFNIRELFYSINETNKSLSSVTTSDIIYSVPQENYFPIDNIHLYYNPFTRTQVVETKDINDNPRADIYVYAPGCGMAYYTLGFEKVPTGLITTISDDENALEYNNGLVKAAAGTSIQVYNLSGMFIQTLNVPQTGSVSIENLPSGFYVLSAGNNHLKICK